MSLDDSAGRIRSAASLLVKGGTLTSEPCPKCGGVQVRFADKTTCINCGNETNLLQTQEVPEENMTVQSSSQLPSIASIMEEKIAALAEDLRTENDISLQKEKAELLEIFLRILEKTRTLLR